MTRTADVLEVKRQSVKTHISGRCRGCERHDKKRHVYQWPRALKYLLRDAWCPACGAKLRGSSVELRDPIVYHGTPEFIPIHRAPAPRGRQVKDQLKRLPGVQAAGPPGTYYVYGDDGQEVITADSLQAAADIVRGKITPAMLADGGWAVVRDEATMESIEIGACP